MYFNDFERNMDWKGPIRWSGQKGSMEEGLARKSWSLMGEKHRGTFTFWKASFNATSVRC